MDTNKFDFSKRIPAIDILRALTVFLMIFVNDLWTVDGVPQWMLHAETNVDFLGLADVVFPIFLFVVGMSIPFAIERRISKGYSDIDTIGHILSRTFALLIMGTFIVNSETGLSNEIIIKTPYFRAIMVVAFFMIWNQYPKTEKSVRHLYTALKITGVLTLIIIAFMYRDAGGGYFRARWWGILGLIGWTYFVSAFIYLFVRNKIPKIFCIWAVLLVFCMLKSSRLFPTEANFINDLAGLLHIGSGSSLALTMGGVLFSLVIVKYSYVEDWKKIVFLISTVFILLIAAKISNEFWIISKNKETPPWVLYSTAITIAAYGLLHWAVVKGKAKWFNIIKAGGTATLSCYVMPYLLPTIKIGALGLVKCAIWALLCILITALLERFKIKLKI